MPDAPKAKIEARGNAVLNAATCLIGMARMAERSEKRRTISAVLSLEVSLTGGGTETWEITIERTASSH